MEQAEHKEVLLSLLKNFTNGKSDMKQLLENYDSILKENDALQTQSNEQFLTSIHPKICTRCKGSFNPLENSEVKNFGNISLLKFFCSIHVFFILEI